MVDRDHNAAWSYGTVQFGTSGSKKLDFDIGQRKSKREVTDRTRSSSANPVAAD